MPFSTTTTLLLLLLPFSSSSATHPRRILHQPIFSGDSPPPSSSPPSPDIPFSNPNTPFFPSSPPPPPPPPTPATPSSLASFPANISSLNLPGPTKSNSPSTKLILTAVAVVLAALLLLLLIVIFLHRRKRKPHSAPPEAKTTRSDTSSSLNNQTLNAIPKLTRPSQTSAEFLYLGTLVNSHVNLDPHPHPHNQSQSARSNTHGSGLNPRKMDSPELHPLPPLLNRQQQMNSGAQNVEVENEEFYSPRGSGSIGVGSASRRDFASIHVSSSSSSSSYSCSSSVSGSPARSASSSVSPSVSVSPKRSVSRPKSPDLEAVELHVPPPVGPVALVVRSPTPSSLSSPVSSLSADRLPSGLVGSSPRISSASSDDDYIEIEPPVTVSDSVQKNVLVFNPFRFSSVLDENGGSPERNKEDVVQKEQDFNLGSAYLSDQNEDLNGLISSPLDDNTEHVPESNPQTSVVFAQDVESLDRVSSLAVEENEYSDVSDESLESLKSVTNPVKDNGDSSENSDEDVRSPERVTSPVMQADDVSEQESFNVPDHSVESPVKQEIPVLVPSVQLPQPISVPPPPPPPPIKYWDSPRTPTPPAKKPISAPPALVTPLKPLVIESPILISPMQLPTASDDHESNEASVGRSDNLDEANERSDETPKPKLKPLHWDKVRASSDREMVWDQLRSSSFKLNEEMIESLFIVKAPNPTHAETTRRQILPLPNQDNRVLDPKKSQNIAILLKALHVTVDEVCESLLEGNAETLGTDLLESLLKMAPTKEEEYKVKEHKDDSPIKLGPAERFLKEVLDIPFAFKRVDAMLYISNFDSEVEYLKKSFETLETACEELRNSRMFLKLLEAVLKTGNRMNVGTNRGDAHAFKLDTLLKLIDVKGADGKTTLLHFVVQEITRSEGARIAASNENQTSTTNDDVKCRKLGLQVVSSIALDLSSVKKAAAMDSEILHSYVMKLSKGIEKILEVIRLNETISSDQSSSNKFSETMNGFLKTAEEEIIRIQAQESVALTVVKEITEYFHGNSTKEEAHPFRIFMVVRDFLSVLERVCKEVGMINERTIVSSAHKFPVPVNPMLQQVSSGFPGRRQYSSSDDESPTT